MTQQIVKIVITGGPCAGKSTALSWIQKHFSQQGWTTLFVPETATEFISGGVAPWTCGSNAEYQVVQMSLQREKERLFEQAARTMPGERILIVCDRGMLDNCAYMNDEEMAWVMEQIGANEVELRDGYDAVFHLVTAAKGAEEFYTTANNSARIETVEQAVEMDNRIIAAWTGHPHFRVVNNETDFEEKMRRLIREIATFLGGPEPLEIERKYLIEYPDLAWLESLPNCNRLDVIQTYLTAPEGEERRVRQRGSGGHYLFSLTTKRAIDGLKRVEVEKRLTKDEYLLALMEADVTRRQIRKTRYCLTWGIQYFEIDVYPFWQDKAIVEIELSDENEPIDFPPQLHVIREVTHDPAYKNAELAAN
ncbi:MAG: AAA family ATPase [Aristaeellaceae bacterium]